MEQREITLGTVTYQVKRVYQGNRPAAELITDRLVQNFPRAQPIDDDPAEAV